MNTNIEQKLPLFLFLNAIYDLMNNDLLEVEKLEFLTLE